MRPRPWPDVLADTFALLCICVAMAAATFIVVWIWTDYCRPRGYFPLCNL